LKKQRTNYPFYFTRIMHIGSFFTDSVELIEEHYTRTCFEKIKGCLQSRSSFTEITSNDSFIAHHIERQS